MEIESEFNEQALQTELTVKTTTHAQQEEILKTLAAQYTKTQSTQKLLALVETTKTLVSEENKMYLAKMFREILNTVEENDSEERAVMSEVTFSVLQWSITEKK